MFYIKVADSSGFVKKIKELGGDKIGVGGSFGHQKTWILNVGDQIRIAAGHESEEEFENILEVFKKASENI